MSVSVENERANVWVDGKTDCKDGEEKRKKERRIHKSENFYYRILFLRCCWVGMIFYGLALCPPAECGNVSHSVFSFSQVSMYRYRWTVYIQASRFDCV